MLHSLNQENTSRQRGRPAPPRCPAAVVDGCGICKARGEVSQIITARLPLDHRVGKLLAHAFNSRARNKLTALRVINVINAI